MSTALDLGDLEGAREELRDAIVELVGIALTNPSVKENLTRLVLEIGSAHATIERAIEACGEPAKGANDG